jgi:hypothetical protein
VPCQEAAARHVHRDVRGNPGTLAFRASDRRLGVVNRSRSNLHIDIRLVIERQTQRPVSRERIAPNRRAELGEQGAQRLAGRRRGLFSPNRRRKLLPRRDTVAVIDKPGECDPSLGPRQPPRQLSSLGFHDEAPTQLHDHIGEHTDMAKRIVCECGYTIQGEDDKQVVELGREHMAANHPAIAAVITTEQLLEMAEEE